MHSLGFVHNDLKLDNIVLGKKDPTQVFLIDFGLSTKFEDDAGNHVEK